MSVYSEPTTQSKPFDWRSHLKIHPAAQLFPLLPATELKELAEDIKKNGLIDPIVYWSKDAELLLDGRNRIDAMALVGLLGVDDDTGRLSDLGSGNQIKLQFYTDGDPYAIALALNIRRRHLQSKEKRDLIAKILKQQPSKSNRQIARVVRTDDKTVGAVRNKMERRAEIPHEKTREDSQGRQQPARKPNSAPNKTAEPEPVETTVDSKTESSVTEPAVGDDASASAEPRKAEHAAAADTPPTGTKAGVRGVKAKDRALDEFNGQVLRLLQKIKNAKPERFAKTAAKANDLTKLGRFLIDLANLKNNKAAES
jgi:hypothetical protein